jgi:hypothetical protein
MNTVIPPIQVITKYLKNPNFDLYYPVITGLKNITVQQKINSDIFRLVYQLIARQGYFDNTKIQVTGWYEIKTNERGLLSLNIGNYAYAPMSAHGMTYIESLTFDTTTGKLYHLGELFRPQSDYVRVLSNIIKLQIAQRKLPLLNGFNSIRPNQDFYIADKALVIYFQLYEITPYYVGLPMFPISAFYLQDIISTNSPLNKMATND